MSALQLVFLDFSLLENSPKEEKKANSLLNAITKATDKTKNFKSNSSLILIGVPKGEPLPSSGDIFGRLDNQPNHTITKVINVLENCFARIKEKVAFLYVRNVPLKEKHLEKLSTVFPHVETLALWNCTIGTKQAEKIKKFAKLSHLTLGLPRPDEDQNLKNKISEEAIGSIKSALPNCKINLTQKSDGYLALAIRNRPEHQQSTSTTPEEQPSTPTILQTQTTDKKPSTLLQRICSLFRCCCCCKKSKSN